jgi:hypothetical protein
MNTKTEETKIVIHIIVVKKLRFCYSHFLLTRIAEIQLSISEHETYFLFLFEKNSKYKFFTNMLKYPQRLENCVMLKKNIKKEIVNINKPER